MSGGRQKSGLYGPKIQFAASNDGAGACSPPKALRLEGGVVVTFKERKNMNKTRGVLAPKKREPGKRKELENEGVSRESFVLQELKHVSH
jgi:hypothetical protein